MKSQRKNVLVVSLGSSPPVVTETLWALARRAVPFWPAELHIVTTKGARDLEALADLSMPSARQMGPKLKELCGVLGMEEFPVFVHLPIARDAAGGRTEVEDIRSVAEAIAFGDCIGDVVRVITSDPATRLHLSIAGGRKTMSYHAGAAMTLFGRAGDEVSHVLVHPSDLEACEDFWWPTETQHWVLHRVAKEPDGSPRRVNAHKESVRIDLIETPFFRARPYLSGELLMAPVNYDRVVQLANLGAGRPKLVIDLALDTARVGDILIRLSPSELALYALFARRARDGEPPISVKVLNNIHAPAREEFERLRNAVSSVQAQALGKPKQGGTINSLMSRLCKEVNTSLVQPELLTRFGLIEPPGAKRGFYAMPARPEEIELNLGRAAEKEKPPHANV